ncbi:MAG TPA: hypothetical protein VE081_14645 [Sporichthyaceae bacterium]|nr:hypothetical protein [Sporichthyaceae bacterium]
MSRVDWQEALRHPGTTLRRIRGFLPPEVRRARIAREETRSALAEVQSSLRKTNGKLRAAREEMRSSLGPLRAELAEARGEVEALRRLYESDEVPEAVRLTLQELRRGADAPAARELLELADAAAAVRDLPGRLLVLGTAETAVPVVLGAAGGAERVDVPVNGVLPDGPSALAYLAGPAVDRLTEVAARLSPGGRIVIEGYRTPEARRVVARFLDEHAGLMCVRSALLHLVPEPD